MRFVYGFRPRPNPNIELEPMQNWELEAILERESQEGFENFQNSGLCQSIDLFVVIIRNII